MIKLVVKNTYVPGKMFTYMPGTEVFVGELLANPAHIPDNFVTISGDGFIPYRIIKKSDIVQIDDTQVEFEDVTPSSQVRLVQGSKGNIYTVTNSAGKWSCTCPGFGFRRECKHIRSVQ